jgi:hypothetical protein
LSFVALQPDGQQPSDPAQAMTAACEHCTLHCPAEPVRTSVVQAFISLQPVGQFPSHVSGGSTIMLPHMAEQSSSF